MKQSDKQEENKPCTIHGVMWRFAMWPPLQQCSVSGSDLLCKARQMRLEQQQKIDSHTEYYNEYEIGVLNGIDRIVKLIERHYR